MIDRESNNTICVCVILSSKRINRVLRYTHIHNKCVFVLFKITVLHGNTFKPPASVSADIPHLPTSKFKPSAIHIQLDVSSISTLTIIIVYCAPDLNLKQRGGVLLHILCIAV